MGSPTTNRNSVLIAGITPYFLEKGNFWFEENLQQIIQARKTQSFFKNNVLCLETDQKYNPYQLLRELDEIGYEKVLQVSEPGEFSQRGGKIDVFRSQGIKRGRFSGPLRSRHWHLSPTISHR